MLSTRTNVGDRRRQIGRQFALDIQVPRHQVVTLWIVLDVALAQLIQALQKRKTSRWEAPRRQWGSTSLFGEWSRTEGCQPVLVDKRKDIEYADAAPNRCLLVSKRVPGKTDPWFKVAESRILKKWTAQVRRRSR